MNNIYWAARKRQGLLLTLDTPCKTVRQHQANVNSRESLNAGICTLLEQR